MLEILIKNSQIKDTSNIEHGCQVIESDVGHKCWLGKGVLFCYSKLGDYSYISRNSSVFSSAIAKYSSISWNVSIGPANHDINRISSHSMLYASRFSMLSGEPFYNQYDGTVNIGNDVWIGCSSTIIRGVTIGDGAVIGANSVITKDVEPYSVVVGNNRVLRKRFTDDIINRLLDIKWWNYPDVIIKKGLPFLAQKPTILILDSFESFLRDSVILY